MRLSRADAGKDPVEEATRQKQTRISVTQATFKKIVEIGWKSNTRFGRPLMPNESATGSDRPVYFVVNADRTAAGVIGMWRNLTPVAA